MSIVHITDSNFNEEVVNSSIPVIIDFWAPWCGPCQMMGPVFEEISKDYEGKLKFVKVNTENNSNISSQFNITGIPALIITKQGKEVNRLVGFMPKEILKQKINELL
jgi:thioredoxin 1